jgi:CHAT domain-containing protein
MSLWPVHDRTTRELMEMVYHAMGRVYLSPAEAAHGRDEGTAAALSRGVAGFAGVSDLAAHLAGAQRGLIARGMHPAMWAPFVVMGEPA